MSDWITDRLPKRDDVEAIYDFVWAIREDGEMIMSHWSNIVEGQPWQVFRKPAPYVKPKRWTVRFDGDSAWEGQTLWALYDWDLRCSSLAGLSSYDEHAEAAQRIADIYNEVMP
jgi:hypothetical protein